MYSTTDSYNWFLKVHFALRFVVGCLLGCFYVLFRVRQKYALCIILEKPLPFHFPCPTTYIRVEKNGHFFWNSGKECRFRKKSLERETIKQFFMRDPLMNEIFRSILSISRAFLEFRFHFFRFKKLRIPILRVPVSIRFQFGSLRYLNVHVPST